MRLRCLLPIILFLLGFLCGALFFALLKPIPFNPTVRIPDVLLPLIVPGAHRFYCVAGLEGQISIDYLLHSTFPAQSVLSDFNNVLSKRGFHPLKEDFFTGEPLSHIQGWRKRQYALAPLRRGISILARKPNLALRRCVAHDGIVDHFFPLP